MKEPYIIPSGLQGIDLSFESYTRLLVLDAPRCLTRMELARLKRIKSNLESEPSSDRRYILLGVVCKNILLLDELMQLSELNRYSNMTQRSAVRWLAAGDELPLPMTMTRKEFHQCQLPQQENQ